MIATIYLKIIYEKRDFNMLRLIVILVVIAAIIAGLAFILNRKRRKK